MWQFDKIGNELSEDGDALVWLKERARELINRGSSEGCADWQVSRRVRLRDDAGEVLFEGTLEEAANL